jgi:hypothetical protein
MVVASDVNIRMVMTRVLGDQRYFVEHMEVASDANIRWLQQGARGSMLFAQHIEVASDVDIWMVVRIQGIVERMQGTGERTGERVLL